MLVCVCVCVSVCVLHAPEWEGICSYTGACGGQRRRMDAIYGFLHPIALTQGPSLDQKFNLQVDQLASETSVHEQ